jgi:hypothetical protein
MHGSGQQAPQGYADRGGASRYFRQVQSVQDLYEYLRTLISPPSSAQRPVAVVLTAWPEETWAPTSATGFIIHGFVPTEEQVAMLSCALMPGGHLCLIAPDDQPTGHTGAIRLEDAAFEIRDAILWVRSPGALHYVAKANRSEREAGCAGLPARRGFDAVERREGSAGVQNHHPTCKPIEIMTRLLEDVPKDQGPVLDPFLGSGTTLIACRQTGHDGIGIEREEEYLQIADARVRYWNMAHQGWVGATIQSDVSPTPKEEEAQPTPIEDWFD